MNAATLQRLIDEFHDTSAQQWWLRLMTVAAALAAVLAASAESGRSWPAGLFIVSALAIASALRPDNQIALVVIVVVVWHWLATVSDIATAWLPVAAACLLAFHSLTALSASIPIGGTIPLETIGRWARSVAITGGATVAMWVIVVVLDGRDSRGNGVLTALALAVVAGAAVMIRWHTLDARRSGA